MKTYQDDLGYLRAGLEDGQAYLLSDQLYGMLAEGQPSGGEYPALTLGSMLLSLARLQVEAQTPAQQAEVQQVEAKLDHLRSRWQIAWGKKAAWEFRARVKQWETYLQEVRQDSEKKFDFVLVNTGEKELLIQNIRASNTAFSAVTEAEVMAPGAEVRFTAYARPINTTPHLRGHILIRTDNAALGEIRVPARGTITRPDGK